MEENKAVIGRKLSCHEEKLSCYQETKLRLKRIAHELKAVIVIEKRKIL